MKTKDPQILAVVGLIIMMFGLLFLFNNPIELRNFPLNVGWAFWIGMILFIGGILGVYYGLKG